MSVNSTRLLQISNGFLQATFAIIVLVLICYGATSRHMILTFNGDEVMKSYGTAIPATLTMVLGILLLICVLLGCFGLWRESTCCMETYSAFLILLALCHFGLGTYTEVHFNTLETSIGIRIGKRLWETTNGFSGPCFQGTNQFDINLCPVIVYALIAENNIKLGQISLAVGGVELVGALLGLYLSRCIWRRRPLTLT